MPPPAALPDCATLHQKAVKKLSIPAENLISGEKVVLMTPTSNTPVRIEIRPKADMAEKGLKNAPTN